jgi:trans-aconitate 2-methyltransferase
MLTWDSEQYLKFKKQRTQPAIDLAKRISNRNPFNILDIGCGPGNSTAILRDFFPTAKILGVDSSEEMIKKARESNSNINFKLCDVLSELDSLDKYDIIFSNACLQWIPNHKSFIPKLFDKLNTNGILAVQIPMNSQEPLFKIMDNVVKNPKWNFSDKTEINETLSPSQYFDILSLCSTSFDIWETVYYHNMTSIQNMIEWIKGTRLRPYLDLLDNTDAKKLEKEITDQISSVYKKQINGEIIFKFRRFFFIATK